MLRAGWQVHAETGHRVPFKMAARDSELQALIREPMTILRWGLIVLARAQSARSATSGSTEAARRAGK